MSKQFMLKDEIEHEHLEWGVRGWHSLPRFTGAKDLAMCEVELMPGFGHGFHVHDNQEEVCYVLEGEIEQWLGAEKRILKAGDSAFIGRGVVHASYNVSDKPVKTLAILGPCFGDDGYDLVELSDEEPWASLRK